MPTHQSRGTRLGVVGAGTMGSGIALTALSAGLAVALHDTSPEALGRADIYLRKHLQKAGKEAALDGLRQTAQLKELADCDVIIEAAPEDLGLKQTLFAELDRLCPPPALLATNTSTLSVTAIASATATPERIAGLHFFNPAPLMPLVEVARGAHSAPATIETLVKLIEQMGKTPVVTADTPGFIVNRVARPFYGEALRILGEGTAPHDQIDRIVELGAGFRMGPFRLMDLIGIDVNFAATRSMWEQTFGEPRYRPHPIQERMVQQGTLGRKTGRGFYVYGAREAMPPLDLPEARRDNSGLVLVSEGSWAPGLAERLGGAGYSLREAHGEIPVAGFVIAGREEEARSILERLDRGLSPETPIFCQVCDQTLAEATGSVPGRGRIFGFDGLFAAQGKALSLVSPTDAFETARANAETLISGLGLRAEWIGDGAGLVLPRVMSMLANEAAFALAEGTADEGTIDLAMRLGANYPVGPLAWLRQVGAQKVLRVLEHLRAVFAEERYRVAPLLRRWANEDRTVRS
ncbi:MAG TPA: 3-hydroxyacyl-CoA dehydrogenase NAD-binding domain-containing protein [Anaerolineales bacterium]|nr:3-hydroxyacyl-CoA dehydrogenase NAD-binding domain-containing protein [Anaerolineales bacterium]